MQKVSSFDFERIARMCMANADEFRKMMRVSIPLINDARRVRLFVLYN
jgi:hypothetical protein